MMRSIYKMVILCAFCLFFLGVNDSIFAVNRSHSQEVSGKTGNVVAQNNNETSKSKTVNINDADVATLEKVKGIGPKRAAAIIAYRDEHGKFQSVDDLAKVKGIGSKRLGKMKHSLTV